MDTSERKRRRFDSQLNGDTANQQNEMSPPASAARFIYWMTEQRRPWKLIEDTREEKEKAINAGAMHFSAWSMSTPYEEGKPEPVRFGPCIFDFDSKDDPSLAQADLRKLLDYLAETYALQPEQVSLYASGGKGFHAIIPATVFGAESGDTHLPLIFKRIAAEWKAILNLSTMDMQVYSMKRGRLFRIPNIRRDNGRYKVAITVQELGLPIDDLLALTATPRHLQPSTPPAIANEKLSQLFINVRKDVHKIAVGNQVAQPLSKSQLKLLTETEALCINHILTKYPPKSDHVDFNRLLMNLVAYMQAASFDADKAWGMIKGFVEDYPHSDTYDTPAKRRDAFWSMWHYQIGNDGYQFHCSFARGLRLPEMSIMCAKCHANMDDVPTVLLPSSGSEVRITDTAIHLGTIYANNMKLYLRTGTSSQESIQVQYISNGTLLTLGHSKACSEIEKVALLKVIKTSKSKGRYLSPTTLTEGTIKRILIASELHSKLPPIALITKCPVIIPDGEGARVITGYDRTTAVYAHGKPPPVMSLEEAKEQLLGVVEEYDFATPSDKSRCLACMLTPAFIMGGLGNFRSPIQFIEADESQTGKGFLTRIIAAIYRDVPTAINQQSGGVGSLEESMNSALIEGRPFINLDNLLPVKGGIFNSAKLASLMTEETYAARVPYQPVVFVDPTRHIIQATTNGCPLAPDIMNRACPVALRKRHGFQFREYPEGNILRHVHANQPRYLGAVFSVVMVWVEAGKPKTDTTAHESSFTPWAQTMDWIVQNLLDLPPLLDGLKDRRTRIQSKDLDLVRAWAIAVRDENALGRPMIVSELLDIASNHGVPLPFKGDAPLSELTEEDRTQAKKQAGAIFSRVFKLHGESVNTLHLDGFTINRNETKKNYDGTTATVYIYTFNLER